MHSGMKVPKYKNNNDNAQKCNRILSVVLLFFLIFSCFSLYSGFVDNSAAEAAAKRKVRVGYYIAPGFWIRCTAVLTGLKMARRQWRCLNLLAGTITM